MKDQLPRRTSFKKILIIILGKKTKHCIHPKLRCWIFVNYMFSNIKAAEIKDRLSSVLEVVGEEKGNDQSTSPRHWFRGDTKLAAPGDPVLSGHCSWCAASLSPIIAAEVHTATVAAIAREPGPWQVRHHPLPYPTLQWLAKYFLPPLTTLSKEPKELAISLARLWVCL